jgi:hypothetical protein
MQSAPANLLLLISNHDWEEFCVNIKQSNMILGWYDKNESNDYVVLLRNIALSITLNIPRIDIILPQNIPLIILPISSFVYKTRLISQELELYIIQNHNKMVRIVDTCVRKNVLYIRTYKEEDAKCILDVFPSARFISQQKKIGLEINDIIYNMEVYSKHIQNRLVYIFWDIKNCRIYRDMLYDAKFIKNVKEMISRVVGYGWKGTAFNMPIMFFDDDSKCSHDLISERLNHNIKEIGHVPIICCFGTDADIEFFSKFSNRIIHVSTSYICDSKPKHGSIFFSISLHNLINLNIGDIPVPPHFIHFVTQISYLYPQICVLDMGFDKFSHILCPRSYGFHSEFEILERMKNIGNVVYDTTQGVLFKKISKILRYPIQIYGQKSYEQLVQIYNVPSQWKNHFSIQVYPSLRNISEVFFPIQAQIEVHAPFGEMLCAEAQLWMIEQIGHIEEKYPVSFTNNNIWKHIINIESWIQYDMIYTYCSDYVCDDGDVNIKLIPIDVSKYTRFPLMIRVFVRANQVLLHENVDIIRFNIVQIMNK